MSIRKTTEMCRNISSVIPTFCFIYSQNYESQVAIVPMRVVLRVVIPKVNNIIYTLTC